LNGQHNDGLVLVTGASGFVGRHLVRFLSGKGEQVRALYQNTPPDEELKSLPNTIWQQCDLLDVYDVEAAMEGVAEVYHCAAIVSFHAKDKPYMLHFNVESTANVVNEALERGIRKLIYLSSVAALGRNGEQKIITEEEQWEESRYNSSYGYSKNMAEMEVWRAIGEGLSAAILNPGIILGAGDWNKGSAALMRIVNKEFPYYTAGINSWVDVADVVNTAWQLMKSDIEAERFIVSGGNFAYKDIFTMMANALKKRPPHIAANRFMSDLVWRFGKLKSRFTGKSPSVTKEMARTAQERCFYDNSKLLKALPNFSYTPIELTIEGMASAFINDLNKK
jgi:nucleoside-diphosphate-sugar epimerase